MRFTKRVPPGKDLTDTRLHRADATLSRYVCTGMSALIGLGLLATLSIRSTLAAACLSVLRPSPGARPGGLRGSAGSPTAPRRLRNVAVIIGLWGMGAWIFGGGS